MAEPEIKAIDAHFPIWKDAGMESALRQSRIARNQLLKDAAADLGVASSVLHKWECGQVPADRVLHVETVTGISRHVLRPDVFGVAEAVAS